MFFICLTAVLSSILNTYDSFAIPALTPALLNIVLIISVIFISPYFEEPVFALAWGVLIGWNSATYFSVLPFSENGLIPKN